MTPVAVLGEQLSQQIRAVKAYFLKQGGDPSVIDPAFFRYWTEVGKTPAQQWAIANNTAIVIEK
jgi:hypothetical protein